MDEPKMIGHQPTLLDIQRQDPCAYALAARRAREMPHGDWPAFRRWFYQSLAECNTYFSASSERGRAN